MIALKIIDAVIIALIACIIFVAGGIHKEMPKQEEEDKRSNL